jgi:hypothetical protein
VPSWKEHQTGLARLAQAQLFFIGGAPRSGTTWLQCLLDSHPEVSCRGEGLFLKHLAEPLDALIASRRDALAAKNAAVFRETGGYTLPEAEDADILLGTAMLLELERQRAGKHCRAIGEKTPENVFFFPRLKRLFPAAKFIGIARDPRDVLTSAWHFFHKAAAGEDAAEAKLAFIRSALPSVDNGTRTMLALRDKYPSDSRIVTYERMREAPEPVAAALFDFLGVPSDPAIVAACVARTSFSALAGGRSAGVAQNGSFFRIGVPRDWRSTLTPAMNALILRELGWMFPLFGWTP